jgi:hypothetical protein
LQPLERLRESVGAEVIRSANLCVNRNAGEEASGRDSRQEQDQSAHDKGF